MTITEFLLARIADDESCQHCGHSVAQHLGQWCRVPTGAIKRDGTERICCCEGADSKSRALAECAARRQILNDCLRSAAGRDGDSTHRLAVRVIKTLALAYADHPEYREEWRP